MVQDVWRRVAEDYAPFSVDVTTQDPPAATLLRANAGDQVYGVRALISPSTAAETNICGAGGCGGVAYLNVFDDATFTPQFQAFYQPAWVFPQSLGPGSPLATKYIAEATSHEVGHNLSLNHDGTNVLGYYAGHANWAPIMGVGYDEPVVQWSKGEYTNANNTGEDDVAIISQARHAPYRTDEAGGTFGTAAAFGVGPAYITTRTDVDVYALGTCTGPVTLAANPVAVSPNLDIQLRMLDSVGAQVAINDPPSGQSTDDVATGMNAAIALTPPTGTYFLEVDGIGTGAPTTAYNDYGSIGAYTLAQTGCGGPPGNVAPNVTLDPVDQTVPVGGTATFTSAATGTPAPTVQWQVDNGGGFANIAGATNPTLNVPSVTLAMNGYDYQAVWTNVAGTDTSNPANLTVVNGVAPVVTLNPVSQTKLVGQSVTFTAAASGTPTPTVQWQVDTGGGFNNLAGATNTTLTIPSVTLAMNGNKYRAVFTNVAGTATTTAATLTVLAAVCDETARGSLPGTGAQQIPVQFTTVPGQLDGCLTGPAAADFDLILQYQARTGWVSVASSAGPTSTETVIYNATQAGKYRWVVYSFSGSGSYTLKYGRP